jgi:bifunctional DNA-binding transcriptional regulator/antitoxin component of YhaV-PrlF toxin-antitoxin module
MAALTSRTRAQGGSITTTVPTEATRKMGLQPGAELYWVEDGMGGYHVLPYDPEVAEALRAHEEIMEEYREVFAALAK